VINIKNKYYLIFNNNNNHSIAAALLNKVHGSPLTIIITSSLPCFDRLYNKRWCVVFCHLKMSWLLAKL